MLFRTPTKQCMSRQRISVDDKLRLIKTLCSLQDYLLLADQLNKTVKRSIVSNATKNEDPKQIVEKTRGDRSHVDEMREAIADIIEENSAATLKTIYKHLRETSRKAADP